MIEISAGPAIAGLVALFIFHCISRAMGYREAMKDAVKIYQSDRDVDDPSPTDEKL